MYKKIIFPLITLSFYFSQNIQINEVVSSNQSSYFDEDGDNPDWIELYNSSAEDIFLGEWGLSDEPNNPFKWRIPSINLEPESFLLVMASDKNRTDMISDWETVVDLEDSWQYYVAIQEPDSNWNEINFNPDNWSTGPSGFGYGDGDDNTELSNTISVYLIKSFQIIDHHTIKRIAFHIDYDDGFVAYLNGNEIARDNVEGTPPAFDQGAITWREAEMINGGEPSLFWIDSTITWVNEGENVLAIQVHNYNISSSDLSCIPFLTLGRETVSDNIPNIAEEIDLPISMLHSNFKISSAGEEILITNPDSVLVDSIYTGALQTDVSFGRIGESEEYGMFLNPTPGESNGQESVLGILNEINFSHETGFYNDSSITVTINTSDQDAVIYYTLDGSEPTMNSSFYINPILIQENKVLKAVSFKIGWIDSPIKTSTFILNNDNNNLPSMFLSTDPDNFFDYNAGIYEMGPNASGNYPHFGANFWEDWERPIFIELLETDNEYFSSPGGVKIFGGWSRGQSQKSLSLFARGEYGNNEFNYRFFPDLEIENFQSLILRNSGNDWTHTMLRDAFATSIFENIDIDIQAYRPILVYLNGEFWGLYNIREKVNEHFIASHHPVDPDEIDLIEVQTANQGTIDNYSQLINYVNNNQMTDSVIFDSLSNWIDIDNHIDYNIAQIFIDNRDWPGNNIKYWREQSSNGLWRWILYDTDFSFGAPWQGLGYNFNTLEFAAEDDGPFWPNPPWSTLLFRRLLENEDYRERFVNIFCDRFNSIFQSEYMVNRLDIMTENIEEIIPLHQERWPGSASNWDYNIDLIRTFAENRPDYMRQYLESYFSLSDLVETNFYAVTGGKIQINTLVPSTYPWTGDYYQNTPINVSAIPDSGYVFSGWAQFPDSAASMRIQVFDDFNLTAFFIRSIVGDSAKLVINEINYHSPDQFDSGDWIEIYNNDSNLVNMGGWYFTDENTEHRFTFPDSSFIEPRGYIVLSQDTASLISLFPDIQNIYGPFDFGLSGGGEEISLYDFSNRLIDRVEYDDAFPWPVEPDGNGPTLELIHPDSLNQFATSWSFSEGNGTPGYLNSVFEVLSAFDDKNYPNESSLYSVFPNPFNSHVKIILDVPDISQVNLSIVNILGNTVRTFKNQHYYRGLNTIVWDGKNDFGHDLSTGIYFCRLKSENIDNSIKLLYVK